jgi:hypothetical protein
MKCQGRVGVHELEYGSVVSLVEVQEIKGHGTCKKYLNKLSAICLNNKLSGAAEARKLTLLSTSLHRTNH